MAGIRAARWPAIKTREKLMQFPHLKGITITNYTVPARDYVKLLIGTLGTMSGSTTHVVAGYCNPNEPVSAKIARAEEWAVPKERTVSGEKYAMRNVEWSGVLGDKLQLKVRIPKEEQADGDSETEPKHRP
ncbi:hypothetical protein CALVIDRAFT_531197 [Calocera viscosa TUFC12733]|uniref:Uncharacterized protein n=1 Tax=Calocera viscosa (strain TUFC12733) TaxID=1330018 RepID=A0A167GRY5_CALVF|nr:hypothetical protein CALVIDRAFT_531197 [Calocera viscosa TUFC12733]